MEDVTIDTVDRFVQRSSLSHISLLKVDTEGHDILVIEGAEKTIRSKRVDAVLVEAGVKETEKFTPLDMFRSHFDERGYTLHGIYDQDVRDEGLRRCNALFLPRHDAG